MCRIATCIVISELNIYILNNIVEEPMFEKEVSLHVLEYDFDNYGNFVRT